MLKPSIVVVAFDQVSPFHLAVPSLIFGEGHPGPPRFDFKVCAGEPGTINTSVGFSLGIKHGLSTLKTADAIIVPSWRNPDEKPPKPLLKALAIAHQRGAQIVGLCLGAYVLAEAGLLDGRSATTHWAYARDFAKRYPLVNVDANVLYVEDGNMLTSAGTAAGIDCCLHMVRQRYGAEFANNMARRLVVPPHRQGGQAQYIEQPIPTTSKGTRLSGLINKVRSNLDHPHTLDSLASHASMSRRTLTRQFRQLTGTTFGQWLLSERMVFAQRLLESSDHSIDVIAALSGFGSSESFRLHFRRTFRVSPTDWRKTFKG